MPHKALIVWGGWDGHQPEQVADLFDRIMKEVGFEVEVSRSLDVFTDAAKLGRLSLIVPVWTMGSISQPQIEGVCSAVRAGAGIAGCHGGMCDAFRDATEWQFMTGGQWVAHPGNDGVRHMININRKNRSPITKSIADFEVTTEQYYMHVDPTLRVLATTRFPVADGPHVGNGPIDMPVIWTKLYGQGRVFYNSLGHTTAVLEAEPVLTLMRRGFIWAAKK